ncbi:amino acid ABC transporter substrate-binding protein [Ruficoccus amylovorans]|uniref:Amino acid ABC transporter substrate-binding protein n=1 Tax=Ruficoccus amylovorans TaxID=1804625 RepID=A0A842HIX7_9BACT|nr:transporter substrate-binding domain-containing protein [Ruficoccus amylovorans]MBC2596372.1 amino acid ABC transporter substrate-binding protein [Ruficoccus amylovorans]
MDIRSHILRFLLLFTLALPLVGQDTDRPNLSPFRVAPLKVGVTPDSPPLVFKTGDKLEGVEIDLARLLGKQLKRPVQFVELEWEDMIPALQDKRIDIVMSGMTVTREREDLVAFSEPYLEYGQMAMVRSEDKVRYNSINNILSTRAQAGVISDTTGANFVDNHFPRAKPVEFSTPEQATDALVRGQVDLFIYDSPVILWIASKRAGDEIVAVPQNLTVEHLGWAMRKDDTALQNKVNTALTTMQEDGSLNHAIALWLPQMPGIL